jgi:hypothetical protein
MNIKNVKVYGLNESIIRSGYPMQVGDPNDLIDSSVEIRIAPSSDAINRSRKLAKAPSGSGHDNFMKGIIVQFDLQYPEYFSPQLQRYNWIDIISSQSKMHKITSRELTNDDFTADIPLVYLNYMEQKRILCNCEEVTKEARQKAFEELVGLLPSGYLKWMGISTNYLQLKTIWNQRCKHKHKLDEWRIFGEFIQSLPMSKELIVNS